MVTSFCFFFFRIGKPPNFSDLLLPISSNLRTSLKFSWLRWVLFSWIKFGFCLQKKVAWRSNKIVPMLKKTISKQCIPKVVLHNVHFSKCYVTVRPAFLAESKANTTWIFFFAAFNFCRNLLVRVVCSCFAWWLKISSTLIDSNI